MNNRYNTTTMNLRCITLKDSLKRVLWYDTTFMMFWKRHNDTDGEQMSGCQGASVTKKKN